MASKWIEHIKSYAKTHGMSYKDALKDPKCKSAYHEGKGEAKEEPKNNIEMKIEEVKKGRGRPKKYATAEEAKEAKSVKTMESNKRRKEPKNTQEPAQQGEGEEILVVKGAGGEFYQDIKSNAYDPHTRKKIGVWNSRQKKVIPVKKEQPVSNLKLVDFLTSSNKPKETAVPQVASAKEEDDTYVIEKDYEKDIVATTSSLLSQILKETFYRIITDYEDNFKTKIAKTRIHNKIKKASAKEMADLIREYFSPNQPKRINFFTKEKFLKDFGFKVKRKVEGKGLNAGYKAENTNGLGHIYPISHELVLQMLKCC